MHNVVKWPNILLKSCGVNTTGFLKYVRPFYNIMQGLTQFIGKQQQLSAEFIANFYGQLSAVSSNFLGVPVFRRA